MLTVDCKFRVLRCQRFSVIAQFIVGMESLKRFGRRCKRQQRQSNQRREQQKSHAVPACVGD